MKPTFIDPATYPVSPDHINTGRHLFDSFGKQETEISANWLVRFCQERGKGWQSFAVADINEFYHANGRPEEFRFNGLDTDGFLALEGDRYSFTHEFVSTCFRASPAI